MNECTGLCLTPADIGLPEYNHLEIAYAHPDCPEHGDPVVDPSEHVCGGGYEHLRYVREDDIEPNYGK